MWPAAGEEAILAIQADAGGRIEAEYTGDWRIRHLDAYNLEVSGSGRVSVRGKQFLWNGFELSPFEDGETGIAYPKGRCVFVFSDGTVETRLTFQ